MKNVNKPLFIGLLCLLPMLTLKASDSDGHFKRLTMQLDNDTFYDTDRQYTNGLKLVWTSEVLDQFNEHALVLRNLGALVQSLYPEPQDNDMRWVSFYLGQNIYTPDNLGKTQIIDDDRPYAGLLYGALSLHQISGQTRYSTMINIGLLGPSSMGGEAMEGMHKRFHWRYPRGWENQLKNEPILNVGLQWKYKTQWPDSEIRWGTALLPFSSIVLGNGYSGLSSGLEMMWGSLSPSDFGLTQIIGDISLPIPDAAHSKGNTWGFTAYFTLTGNWIWRNITLDGNTFQDSHRVHKEALMGRVLLGFSMRLKYADLSFAHIFQSKEFKTQKKRHDYGVLSLTFHH